MWRPDRFVRPVARAPCRANARHTKTDLKEILSEMAVLYFEANRYKGLSALVPTNHESPGSIGTMRQFLSFPAADPCEQ